MRKVAKSYLLVSVASKRVQVETMKSRADFIRLFQKENRLFVSSWMILSFEKNVLGSPRFGWTLPKYVGVAVVRNRMRRWCREVVREVVKSDPNFPLLDVNVVLRRRDKEFYKSMKYDKFKNTLQGALQKLIKSA